MKDQVHEAMAQMTVQDLRRALTSSERAKDDELVSILSRRLDTLSPSPAMPAQGNRRQ